MEMFLDIILLDIVLLFYDDLFVLFVHFHQLFELPEHQLVF